jgi:glycerophosphoryl diester phosphodiesterase
MIPAIRRFALLTFSVLLCLFLVGVYVNYKALSEPLKTPFAHPFLQTPSSRFIAYRGDSADHPGNSLEALDAAAKTGLSTILWIDLHPQADGTIVAIVDSPKGNSDGSTLKELLEKFPDRKLILNFSGNKPGMIENIVSAVEATHASDRVLIQSPEDGLLRDLREKEPTWIFGTSQAQTTRMKMLASIWLAPVAPIKGDVYVVEWEKSGDASSDGQDHDVDDSIIEEAHRRHLKIFVGPVGNPEKARVFLKRGIDAVMVTRPLSNETAR